MRNIAEEILMGVDSSEKLMHTEEYLGAEFDEGLQHWKYIKKYRNSKGKWTYVYADKNTHDTIKKKYKALERTAKDYYKYGGEYEIADDGTVLPSKENIRARIHVRDAMMKYNDLITANDLSKKYKKMIEKGKSLINKILGKEEEKPAYGKRPKPRQKFVD